MKRHLFLLSCAAAVLGAYGQDFEGAMLQGAPIGCPAIDYATNQQSETVNTAECAFDGDLATYYASYDRSFTWVGLELDQPCVITGVGYAARNDSQGPKRMELGVFQGANNPDFSDALPIFLIPEPGAKGAMTYAPVQCSRGFKYVRYVGPRNARCNVAELEFYGYAGEGDDSALPQVTNLPTVVVNTPGMEWFHENDKEYAMEGSTITIIADGKIDVSAQGQIRGRGNASWGFPKKPFRIKFDKKQKVLGGPAKAKKWTMINNYGDKTLMRNRLAFDISQRVGLPFTPACHFVDLVFNGEYQGCYQLCDQIEVNPGRVEITEMEAADTEGEALTGGYLIEIDAYASGEAPDEWFYSQGGHSIPVTIKSPDPGVAEQYDYIRDYFSTMERAVFASNHTDPENGYRRYLDLDAFLQHFIVGELSGNTDTYWSVYMSLDRGDQQFRTGPVWDFDLAFENDNRTYPINNKSDFIYRYGSYANGMQAFVSRIIKQDAGAKERLRYLWSYARACQGLDNDTFQALIDEYAEELEQSQKLNFKRWPIMNQQVHQNPRVWGSYQAEVQNVRDYIEARFKKLDKLIGIVEIDGLADPESGISARADGRTLRIDGDARWTLANTQGIVVASGSGDASLPLRPGIYLLSTPSATAKIAIR